MRECKASATGVRLGFWIMCAVMAAALIGCAALGTDSHGTHGKTAAASIAAPIIARRLLFGNPDKASPRLSPDGTQLAFLAPVDNVLNVWVGPAGDPGAARPVTADTKRGVRIYFWAYTCKHIVYLQDKDGDENWRVYVVDLASGTTRDLTPIEDVRAEIERVSYKSPEEILIGLNDRDPKLHDIYRLDLLSGERLLIQENPGFAGFITDDEYRIRFATKMTPDGGRQLLQPGADGSWEPFLDIGMADSLTTYTSGFDKSGQVLYLVDSRGRNTAALVTLDLATGEQRLIAEDPKADLSGIMRHPTEKTVEAVAFTYERKHWQVFDSAVAADFERLKTISPGDIAVVSRTLDDTQWIVAFRRDDAPSSFYRYDRRDGNAQFLFTTRRELEGVPLVPMHPVVITSRDGLSLVSYLSLPPGTDTDNDGRPTSPLPMVLQVHGGPWTRAVWGLDPTHQWLANRGYAVLDVNYRGSTGFGKDFVNAANLEWGRKMHDDLIDAVQWAIDQGIADPARVAIFGGSYGGYAALAGLTFTPDVFACAVDVVGPSNLITLINSFPPYWLPMIELWTARVGDHRTEEGRALLAERSPLTYVDRIRKPLLIAQGANDPRVKQAESDQIVQAMKEKDIPVTYVLYPDEGHGFARPENRLSFYAVAEGFLAQQLGGRIEPIGDAFEGASITVPAGAKNVPGLLQALDDEE